MSLSSVSFFIRSRFGRGALLTFLCGAVALSVVAPAYAGPFDDPVLDGVLELLEAELSDPVIREWLATVEEAPRVPTAQDLVALREAGASDVVILAVLSKARGAADGPAPAGRAQSRAVNPSPETPADADEAPGATPEVKPRASEARVAESRTADDFSLRRRPLEAPGPSDAEALVPEGRGAVRTQFILSNSPYWLEDEEPWSLFVYLNGEPLSFVTEGTLLSSKPLRFSKLLSPGPQRLMLFREQHDGEEGVHRTKVMTEAIEFTLEPGGVAEVEVAFKQSVISMGDPVSYRVAQNGRLVDEADGLGGNPDRWTWLCEDLERTLGDGTDGRLEDCVRWRALWRDYPGPTRGQVLEAFANFDYRPVPRDQNLH